MDVMRCLYLMWPRLVADLVHTSGVHVSLTHPGPIAPHTTLRSSKQLRLLDAQIWHHNTVCPSVCRKLHACHVHATGCTVPAKVTSCEAIAARFVRGHRRDPYQCGQAADLHLQAPTLVFPSTQCSLFSLVSMRTDWRMPEIWPCCGTLRVHFACCFTHARRTFSSSQTPACMLQGLQDTGAVYLHG